MRSKFLVSGAFFRPENAPPSAAAYTHGPRDTRLTRAGTGAFKPFRPRDCPRTTGRRSACAVCTRTHVRAQSVQRHRRETASRPSRAPTLRHCRAHTACINKRVSLQIDMHGPLPSASASPFLLNSTQRRPDMLCALALQIISSAARSPSPSRRLERRPGPLSWESGPPATQSPPV